MPGQTSSDQAIKLVGAAFFVVAVVGTALFGWDFGGKSDPIATTLAVIAVAIALAVTALRK